MTDVTFIDFRLHSATSGKCGWYVIAAPSCLVCIDLMLCPCNVECKKFNASSVTFTHLDLVLASDVHMRVVRHARISQGRLQTSIRYVIWQVRSR